MTWGMFFSLLGRIRALLENFLHDRQRREDIWPTDIEGEMRDRLAGFRLRQPIVHRAIEMIGNLRHLTGRNERTDGDYAAVARREVWSEPQVPKQNVGGVLHESGSNVAELLANSRCTLCFGCLVQ